MARKPLRCAIYTRKSSEEGLEQDFNSLNAQREACAAYIKSQVAEGWVELSARYDDGGLSGATLDRPALKRLLGDVEAGKIDVVVVYKVDRLTRSLADFAKIVEIFDARGVSFVSITQQFNTTTSMGRLTLNVLLSFAQFEREVTAERIRDKIAASKKKGLWMGGTVSLGYDVRDKQLVVNPQEAETVRYIYRRYLELGSIPLLQQALVAEGVRSKQRCTRSGRLMGGTSFGRGALYTLLSNPLYRGRIRHKDKTYPGQQEAIVGKDLWEAVQKRLADNRVNPAASDPKGEISLLAGLICDEKGERLTPSHAVKKGKRYRYYLSAALTRGRKVSDASVWRLPAKEIENLVCRRLQDLLAAPAALREALPDPEALSAEVFQRLAARAQQQAKVWPRLSGQEEHRRLQTLVTRICLDPSRIEIDVSSQGLIALLAPEGGLSNGEADNREPEPHRLVVPARLRRRGLGQALVIANDDNRQCTDDTLVRLLARAYDYQAKLLAGNGESLTKFAEREGVTSSYVTRLLRLSYMAPDIVERILEGRQPRTLTAAKLLRLSPDLPHDWKAQRERILAENGPN